MAGLAQVVTLAKLRTPPSPSSIVASPVSERLPNVFVAPALLMILVSREGERAAADLVAGGELEPAGADHKFAGAQFGDPGIDDGGAQAGGTGEAVEAGQGTPGWTDRAGGACGWAAAEPIIVRSGWRVTVTSPTTTSPLAVRMPVVGDLLPIQRRDERMDRRARRAAGEVAAARELELHVAPEIHAARRCGDRAGALQDVARCRGNCPRSAGRDRPARRTPDRGRRRSRWSGPGSRGRR